MILVGILVGSLIGLVLKVATGNVIKVLPEGTKVLPMEKDWRGRWVLRRELQR